MTQAAVSQLQQRSDVYLSTLENFVEAMARTSLPDCGSSLIRETKCCLPADNNQDGLQTRAEASTGPIHLWSSRVQAGPRL